MPQLTITGGFVNRTLFEQAKVELPGPQASWDEWAEATRKVAEATQTRFPMAIDRTGHRVAGPAISYGAEIFAADGTPALVDDGFKTLMAKLVAWMKDGTMARDVWVSQGGAAYQDAAQEFINGRVVYYYSGSWQTGRFEKAIGDAFDWEVVGSPCGPAACSGMPGDAALVAFTRTAAPQAAAKVLDFFASEPVHAQLVERTKKVPAHKGIAAKGLAYQDAGPAGCKALQAWARRVAEIAPAAYACRDYPLNRVMFNATTTRVTQAIVGALLRRGDGQAPDRHRRGRGSGQEVGEAAECARCPRPYRGRVSCARTTFWPISWTGRWWPCTAASAGTASPGSSSRPTL